MIILDVMVQRIGADIIVEVAPDCTSKAQI